jgi:hypothetical protein
MKCDGVGGPTGCREAAKRCTELIRSVGPTLRKGDILWIRKYLKRDSPSGARF